MNRGDNRGHPVSDPHIKRYNMGRNKILGGTHMSIPAFPAN